MQPVLVFVAATVLGIDVGWKPLDEGGVEYTIQIAPSEIARLKELDDLISDVPADLDVRRYRITVGKGTLPQVAPQSNAKPAGDISLATPTDDTPKTYAVPAVVIESGGDAQESTANKPVTGTFAARDPEPEDEEALAASPQTKDVETKPRYSSSLLDREQPRSYRASEPELDERSMTTTKRSASARPRIEEESADYDYAESKVSSKPSSSTFRTATLARERSTKSADAARDSKSAAPSSEPWGPMITSLVVLFMSMGANLYLGWVAWDSRSRYRMLVDRFRMQGKTTAELI